MPGQNIALAIAMLGTSVSAVLEGRAWFALLMAALAVVIVGQWWSRRPGREIVLRDHSSPSERRRFAASCLLTLSFACSVYVFRGSTLLVVVLVGCIVLTWVQWYREPRRS